MLNIEYELRFRFEKDNEKSGESLWIVTAHPKEVLPSLSNKESPEVIGFIVFHRNLRKYVFHASDKFMEYDWGQEDFQKLISKISQLNEDYNIGVG